ncbi:MAG: DUF1778 domain-containing protein [Cyanobacteria bacterium M_DeepCast_100m_m1_067]|nr:DUF1778 domain-containing protein [Cyanobacteria bacterium M_DeepCast_100m_m1_067]
MIRFFAVSIDGPVGSEFVAADERLDLKLSAADKQLFAQAAAIEGVTMAAFVRLAAKARAAEAIQRDQQITLSQQDFKAFHAAIAQPFEPNAALRDALEQARTRVSRV